MSTNISPDLKPVALIAGPTASGKSDLAVKLAQRLGRERRHGVIINADSQQVYRDLHILSARPTEDEMGGIEHRLFGTWDGAEPCSAANWADAAKAAIDVRAAAQVHFAVDQPVVADNVLVGTTPVGPKDGAGVVEDVTAISQKNRAVDIPEIPENI